MASSRRRPIGPDSTIIAGVMAGLRETGEDESVLRRLELLWRSKLQLQEGSEMQEGSELQLQEGSEMQLQEDLSPQPVVRLGGLKRIASRPPPSSAEEEEEEDCQEDFTMVQEVVKSKKKKKIKGVIIPQVDGPVDPMDSSEEEADMKEDDDDDDDEDDEEEDDDSDLDPEGEEYDEGVEQEPLNSEDDISDEDASDLFETNNVVVCQYDKIVRARNKWKFHLKDGIMNLNGRDYAFQRASGEAEW